MSIRRSVVWMFSGQFLMVATNLATTVIIARLLSPHEMGIYAVAFAVLGVLQMIAAFDLSTYVVREKALAPATLDSAFTVNAALCLCLSAAVFLLSFAGAALFDEPAVGRALRLLAVGPLITILEFRPAAMLQREMQFKWISIVTTMRTIVGAGVTIAAAYYGYSYLSLAIGNIAYAATGAAAYNIIGRQHVGLRFTRQDWRRVSGFGIRMMSISGLANLVSRLSDAVLGKMLGLSALGLYSRASSISALIFQNIYGTATRIVFVQLSKDYRDTGVLRDTFLRGLQMITAVMWPALIGLAILSKPVVLLLFGDAWMAAALPLSLLLIAQFVVLGFGMNWELFVLRDETGLQTRYEAIRAFASIALFVPACLISLTAAAASRIVEALLGLALYLPHMNRLAGTRTRDLLRVYGESALLTVAAAAPSAILMLRTGWSASTPLPMIGGAILLGALLWLVTGAWLRHPLLAEIAGVGRRLLGARLPT